MVMVIDSALVRALLCTSLLAPLLVSSAPSAKESISRQEGPKNSYRWHGRRGWPTLHNAQRHTKPHRGAAFPPERCPPTALSLGPNHMRVLRLQSHSTVRRR